MLANVLSRFWWMIVLRGVIAILFGITILAMPQLSLVALVFVFGGFALADGIGNVVTAIGGRREHEGWWVLLIGGLAGIGVGLLTLFSPGTTALALLFYIAIWAIATGLLELVAAVRLRKEIEGELWLGLAGIASIVFGAILLMLAFRARAFVTRAKAAVTR